MLGRDADVSEAGGEDSLVMGVVVFDRNLNLIQIGVRKTPEPGFFDREGEDDRLAVRFDTGAL